ncbi:MAG: hypothetical protein JGK17_18705 [Microcoleus sp. PH2017_10_PVI_O_A]|uniref:hypothetical protein n=1 Tax=unclassified Microcoleus TaxID=2642155 RepID=UPI001D4E2214|nr:MULTISPECIES: hypothetical protein [unclassified Microcoleus]TAE78086.1 MAG: hypothetical protein EAZ83_25360 [Oscillatoriales cyanobacterium]MCC3407585.1 hypothetical protein [Microcoleus sp. PH2017_10_PVI_O_A]MCC3461762.1 hypothetical protein [Microcoleus sp. PH2017_11_PCY_U_A]MCC3480176.1 hypothetical protein [Microcoleus sp. PH2017_12_PCY_D_A]MCC3531749.1 hypothetical protein [Microcoleus sp. PH2017_21_RUC_O_A]
MKLISVNTFMKTPLTSACRHCRHYTPEGRRGGICALLSVPVQSQWNACSLAVSPFGPSWENITEIELWQEQTVSLDETAVIVSERNACQLTGTTLTEKSAAVSV